MKKIKWTFITLLVLTIVGFFNYALPSHDIVRIVGTDVKRVDIGADSWFWAGEDPNAENLGNRDVRFVEAVWPNDQVRVYRNEDTHWGWPPYFKFDSGDVSARAKNLISTKAEPIWVDVLHYGWRFETLSLYPNAITIRQVDGPDVQIIPWFNIIFLSLLAIFALWSWRKIRGWKARSIDPMLDNVSDAFDDAGERIGSLKDDVSVGMADAGYKATGLRDRFSRWLDTWRPKNKRQNRD